MLIQIEAWRRNEAPEILIHANLYKFAQNAQLREKLMGTGDALLVHTFDKYEFNHETKSIIFLNHSRDDLYAIGMNEETTKKWSLDNNGKYIQVSLWSA